MIRKEKYEVNFILDLISKNKNKSKIILDGDITNIGTKSIQMFKKKGITYCIRCGRKGEYFSKEKEESDLNYHLTLYAADVNGKKCCITKDHIVPIVEGGKDNLDNLQPLCILCNDKKGGSPLWSPLSHRQEKYGSKKGMRLPTIEETIRIKEKELDRRSNSVISIYRKQKRKLEVKKKIEEVKKEVLKKRASPLTYNLKIETKYY